MKLGVATICAHIYHQGQWWSYEPFVLEMNLWADLFDGLVLAAPLDSGPPPPSGHPMPTPPKSWCYLIVGIAGAGSINPKPRCGRSRR